MNITIDDFAKLDIRIGTIVSAEKIENTDNLLKLQVDFGSAEQNSGGEAGLPVVRQIVSGIAEWYTPEDLVGKQCPFIFNLEPRTFREVESQGMLLATGTEDGVVLLHPDKEVPTGSKLR